MKIQQSLKANFSHNEKYVLLKKRILIAMKMGKCFISWSELVTLYWDQRAWVTVEYIIG